VRRTVSFFLQKSSWAVDFILPYLQDFQYQYYMEIIVKLVAKMLRFLYLYKRCHVGKPPVRGAQLQSDVFRGQICWIQAP
jgi:hypothetical protein